MEQNLFEQFAEDLYQESPRGWAELQAMRYGIMARTGLNEPDALEVVCRIVVSDKITTNVPKLSDTSKLQAGL